LFANSAVEIDLDRNLQKSGGKALREQIAMTAVKGEGGGTITGRDILRHFALVIEQDGWGGRETGEAGGGDKGGGNQLNSSNWRRVREIGGRNIDGSFHIPPPLHRAQSMSYVRSGKSMLGLEQRRAGK